MIVSYLKILKKHFTEFLKQKEIPNLLLSGTAGTGKTTVARALCEELGADYIIINGSDEGQIDTLRNKIKNFASTVSLTESSAHKVVIVDEADYMNADSVQPALRNFIETFIVIVDLYLLATIRARFYQHYIVVVPLLILQSRMVKKLRQHRRLLKRLGKILEQEEVKYDNKVLAELIQKHYPDFRRTINELQRYSVRGKIDSGILFSLSEANTKELIKILKEKRFNDMRKWVINNLDKEPSSLFSTIYNLLYKNLEGNSVPQAVLVIGGYQYKSAFVADQEINMVGLFDRDNGKL